MRGDSPGPGYSPFLMRDWPLLHRCAQLLGTRTEGVQRARVVYDRGSEEGRLFYFRGLTTFHCSCHFAPLFSVIGKFLWIVCGFFGAYGKSRSTV